MKLHHICTSYLFDDKPNLPSSAPLSQKLDSSYCDDRACQDCAFHSPYAQETTPEYIEEAWYKLMELEPNGPK